MSKTWGRVAKLREKPGTPEALASRIQHMLKAGPRTLRQVSTKLDRGVEQIEQAIAVLEARHVRVRLRDEELTLERTLPVGGQFRIDIQKLRGKTLLFGVVSDTHLGSQYARLDVLNAVYDRFREEGVRDVLHSGNIIEGFKKGINDHEVLPGCGSVEGQIAYLLKNYPQRKGIRTRFISTKCHEGWWTSSIGINIGALIQQRAEEAGRRDLEYLSFIEADITVPAPRGKTVIRLVHPGGGSPYAISYTPQKIVESYSGGTKPAILIVGHHHKKNFGLFREIYTVMAGCTQDQTSFMRIKRIEAHLGGWICRAQQAPDGHISEMSVTDLRYYDRKFYVREKYANW